MAASPDSTRTSLRQRPTDRARERWPRLAEVWVHDRAGFAYIDGVLTKAVASVHFRSSGVQVQAVGSAR